MAATSKKGKKAPTKPSRAAPKNQVIVKGHGKISAKGDVVMGDQVIHGSKYNAARDTNIAKVSTPREFIDQLRQVQNEIVVLKRDLRRATQEFREDYNLRRNEELSALQKVVYKAIVEIAKQENYDLILHEGTIYASKKVDLTDTILKKLGKK